MLKDSCYFVLPILKSDPCLSILVMKLKLVFFSAKVGMNFAWSNNFSYLPPSSISSISSCLFVETAWSYLSSDKWLESLNSIFLTPSSFIQVFLLGMGFKRPFLDIEAFGRTCLGHWYLLCFNFYLISPLRLVLSGLKRCSIWVYFVQA